MEIVDEDVCMFCVEYCLQSDSYRHDIGMTLEIMCCILKHT
jgi:hypothetical protein